MTFYNSAGKVSSIRGERSAIFDLARGRLSLLSTIFVVLYIVIGARLVDLSVVQGMLLKIRGVENIQLSNINETVQRGDIFDRNGVLLATTLKSKSLFADPKLIANADEVTADIVQVLPELDAEDIRDKLSSQKRFVWIARDLTPAQQEAVLNIGEPGLNFKEETRRVYPQGNLASHLIGYTNIDGKGLSGIERAQNDALGASGYDVSSTLDIRLQHVLQKEMLKTVEEFDAKAASAIIMDVKSGEVLAGLSWPFFDPNHAGNATDTQRFNRLTLGVYELGSVFKIFSTAALLEEGAGYGRRFDAREALEHGRFRIRDYHAEKRVLTVPEVFIHSSNIGSALMGEALGTDKIKSYYKDLGLLDPSEFCIREVGKPLTPRPWRKINTLTASYGHGIAVSPLQLAAAVATSVGDGTYVRPYLVMGHNTESLTRRVFSESTAHKMRRLMRLNSIEGTGVKADVEGYRIGGKTGTAEKPGVKGYERDKKISSFVSVFPMNDPEYLVFVVVDEPKGHKGTHYYATGGWVAAPAASRIVKGMVRVLGLEPSEMDDEKFVKPLKRYIRKEDRVASATF